MRTPRPLTLVLTVASFALLATAGWLVIEFSGLKGTKSYEPRAEGELAISSQGHKGAAEYLEELRAGKTPAKVERTESALENFGGPKALNLTWNSEGPVNQGGRTRSILIKKDNPDNMWVGSVSGGIWRSSDRGENWSRIPAFEEEVIVSDIAQLGNGDIYVGTGSAFEGNPGGDGGSEFFGRGLYHTSDNGQSFEKVDGTVPDTNSSTHPWTFINELVADPSDNNGMWIAHSGGLKYYDASSGSMNSTSSFAGIEVYDISISSDGSKMLVVTGGGSIYLSTDGGNNFEELTGFDGELPSAGRRAEVSISKTDDDYMYALMAEGGQGSLQGVFMSKDGGSTWGEIAGQGGGGFQPFYNGLSHQGFYDNALSVRPGHPETIVIGGITFWKWKSQPTQFNQYAGNWSKLTTTNGFPATVPSYVHADVHEFAWKNSEELYIGTDGGVFYSSDGLNSFVPSNKNFVSTQFYSVDFSPENQILGGTQDNGTQYLNREDRWDYATRVRGGDGFDCEISHMDPNVIFATIYGNQGGPYVMRSEFGGSDMTTFLDSVSADLADDFYSNIALYEDRYDSLSQDSLRYVNFDEQNPTDTVNYQAGDTLHYESRTLNKEISTVLNQDLDFKDTIKLPDPVQSLFAFSGLSDPGGNYTVYLTRDALRLSENDVTGHGVLQLGSFVNCYEFSSNGDHLWVGTVDGNVYRVSGLDSAYTESQFQNVVTTEEVHTDSRICTGISVDPNDEDHVALSFGTYGSSDKILESFDATQTNPTFNSIWDNSTNLSQGLLNMPVYDVLIEMEDPNVILAGTEYGVFATDDGGNTWSKESGNGLGHVPVFAIEQQTRDWNEGAKNPGYIYLGTHGRGLFKTTDFKSVRPDERIEGEDREFASLGVYPNPADQRAYLELPEDLEEDLNVRIFDLQGKEVHSTPVDPTQTRDGEMSLPVSELEEGIYIVRASSASYDRSAKLVVSR